MISYSIVERLFDDQGGAEVKVTVDETKRTITIELPLEEKPTLSGSKKNLVIASTRGSMVSEARYAGKLVAVGANAYVKADLAEL